MSCVEWSASSCSRCAGHGQVAASDGFKPCDACNGAGSVPTAAKCCAAHAHGAEDHGHTHGHHGDGSPTTLRAVMEALDLVDEEGTPVKASDAFEGKVVGLYFSARHCPGCERFSPVLAGLTRRHEAELCTVLVSGDGDEETAAAAARGKGFLRVPFHSPHRGILMRAFGIFAIPVLAVWHPALGKSVTGWGHTAVTYNGEKCVRQWHQGGAGYSVMEMMNPFPGTACVPTGC